MNPTRRLLLLVAAASFAASAAHADTWPAKPVTLIVPFPAGGTTDVLARALADRLQAALGQPVVVESKPGAGATLGADMVAKATMLMRLGGYDEPQPLIDAILAMPKANAPLPSLMLGTVRA